MFYQYFQDPPDCSFVFLFCLYKDQNIVQVHYYNPFGYKGPEDVVHHSLKDSRTVGHSKEHHERFEEAMVSVKDSFPFISGLDVYIIKDPVDVQFGKVPGSTELGAEFRDEWKGIFVLDSYGIQHTIVLDQPE